MVVPVTIKIPVTTILEKPAAEDPAPKLWEEVAAEVKVRVPDPLKVPLFVNEAVIVGDGPKGKVQLLPTVTEVVLGDLEIVTDPKVAVAQERAELDAPLNVTVPPVPLMVPPVCVKLPGIVNVWVDVTKFPADWIKSADKVNDLAWVIVPA